MTVPSLDEIECRIKQLRTNKTEVEQRLLKTIEALNNLNCSVDVPSMASLLDTDRKLNMLCSFDELGRLRNEKAQLQSHVQNLKDSMELTALIEKIETLTREKDMKAFLEYDKLKNKMKPIVKDRAEAARLSLIELLKEFIRKGEDIGSLSEIVEAEVLMDDFKVGYLSESLLNEWEGQVTQKWLKTLSESLSQVKQKEKFLNTVFSSVNLKKILIESDLTKLTLIITELKAVIKDIKCDLFSEISQIHLKKESVSIDESKSVEEQYHQLCALYKEAQNRSSLFGTDKSQIEALYDSFIIAWMNRSFQLSDDIFSLRETESLLKQITIFAKSKEKAESLIQGIKKKLIQVISKPLLDLIEEKQESKFSSPSSQVTLLAEKLMLLPQQIEDDVQEQVQSVIDMVCLKYVELVKRLGVKAYVADIKYLKAVIESMGLLVPAEFKNKI